jgi:hypothetical protein
MRRDDYYRVLLAEEWRLVDLYQFPHAYAQNYAFIYCLDSDIAPKDRERINRALEEYPWRGGYSYVNIYTVLQNQVPSKDKPFVKSISKSSPGWLDLFLNIDVALHLAKSVAALSGAAAAAAISYRKISNTLSDMNVDRKKRQLQELKITQAEAKILTGLHPVSETR